MKKFIILFAVILLVACNPTGKLPSLQTKADAAFEQANYNQAYTLYQQYINIATTNNIKLDNALLIKQAQTCGQLDKFDEATSIYSSLLKDEANIKLIAEYAQLLQKNSRTDEELNLWTSNNDRLTEEHLKKLATERTISLHAAKENHQAVVDAFENKGDITLSKELELTHVKALEATKKGNLAAKACNNILKHNPDYTEALDWKAKYYYNKAENRYQYEMAKYNKKKNATTYAYLRRDLKKVSANFRISRDAFLKLRKQDAANKTYIRHLKNIYLRLDQKGEAAKMDKLLK